MTLAVLQKSTSPQQVFDFSVIDQNVGNKIRVALIVKVDLQSRLHSVPLISLHPI